MLGWGHICLGSTVMGYLCLVSLEQTNTELAELGTQNTAPMTAQLKT